MKETLISYIDTLPEGSGRAEEIVGDIISKMKEFIIDTIMSARVLLQ